MLPVWYYFKDKNPSAIVSQSKDGEILSNLLQNWNYEVLRGSSSKGGREVLNDSVEILEKGKTLLITPDGPRGPAHKLKPGAVIASVRSGKPFYFCTVKINHYKEFNTWDKFKLPLPFTSVELSFSERHYFGNDDSRDNIDKIVHNLNLTYGDK